MVDGETVRIRREARREELLAAAIEVIRSVGAGATMEEMATAGGISKPILYRHFHDRDGLVAAISEQAMAQLAAILDERMGDRNITGRDGVRATVDAFFEYIDRDTSLYHFVVDNDMRHGGQGTLAFTEQNAEHVAALLRDGLVAAGRDPAPADAWARGIVGLVHRAATWWLADRERLPRQEVVDQLVDLVWGGIGAQLVPA